ncbi:formin-binding protein 1-like isoform X3 [Bemisia tabaci]|uniref:formin-binding protein 1-like isoform X3 n=1 Tax=Bemisia tabaci TaxID=7038 RepID=UPI0008F9D2A2|nr:PREDICTED: formin-binding protein 1-like isoform X3 [Bemisia tabaci]
MSWGSELWDQYENLSLHTQKGIDFLEKYGHFIRDRCAIEVEYASKLRRLVKNYQPKKREEEDYQYSPCKAFKTVMGEITDLAGQHELIAENLQTDVIREIHMLVKDFKEERKKHLQDGARMMQSLAGQIASLDRAKKNYEKAYKDAEKALESFQKADADLNLSRAEVEKQRMSMMTKNQHCEVTKNEYANQLQRTNELQSQHYRHLMPEVFRQLQELDEKRIRNIRNFMTHSADVERKVFPIMEQCLDGIVKAASQINEKEDTLLVIERYKSGFPPPGDIPFDDLSRNGDAVHITQPLTIPGLHKADTLTIKGTMGAGRLKKRGLIFNIFNSNKNNLSSSGDNKDDFSDLPPNQRRKRLQQKIDEIQNKIQQETAARDGLMKMKGVYEQNPALGDPMSIEGQLNESGHKLDKLRLELQKYQGFLEDGNITNDGNSPANLRRQNSTVNNVNGLQNNYQNNGGGSGGEEESLSRSASDSSVSNSNHQNHNKSLSHLPIHGFSNSPESGLGTSHTSLPDSEYYDLPPLGTCKALYPFEATSEGSIPMYDGEELYIIELDQGDGWTRVRRLNDSEEGFVPTSYIECSVYNS